jgi:hypothetical protein
VSETNNDLAPNCDGYVPSVTGFLTAFPADRLRQSSTVVASVNCLELPADGHFAWDVSWQGLKPNLFQLGYGPTKVVP